MQFPSRNTNIRYDRENCVIGRDLIATCWLAYGKYGWRRVKTIGLTGSVTLGAGGIGASCWIVRRRGDGHASCRHLCSVLQGKLCKHPVTDLPNSEKKQNEQRHGQREFDSGSAPPVLEESLPCHSCHFFLTIACPASVTVVVCHGLGMIGLN